MGIDGWVNSYQETSNLQKAKKTTKYTLFSTQELTENNQRPINKAHKEWQEEKIRRVKIARTKIRKTENRKE